MSELTDNIAPEAAPEEINASCRWPVMFLFFSAALWLVKAAVIGVMGSFKLHMPEFLSDISFLTYGHLQANAWVAFLFGFGGNAGLGLTLWMLSRLRGAPLARPGFVIAGAVLWNVGVTAALVGITLGDQSGVAGLELPVYAGRVLLIGQAFIAFSAILTYFSRRHKQLYPSTWYLMAALVAFPWIVGTAHWLLAAAPVRGAAQIPVGHWATTSLLQVWLGCLGLAAVMYFIPKILGRELFSRQWAAFGFWMLLLLGGWVNLNSGSPLPVWQIKISQFASGLFIFVVIAVGWNLRQTARGVPLLGSENLTLKFMGFALGAWIVSGLFTFCNVCPEWNAILQFTYANTALRHLFAWGFFAMAMLGGIYYVAPRLLGPKIDWACAMTNKWVYRLIAIGTVIMVTAGVGMSWKHGKSLNATIVDEVSEVKVGIAFKYFSGEKLDENVTERTVAEIVKLHKDKKLDPESKIKRVATFTIDGVRREQTYEDSLPASHLAKMLLKPKTASVIKWKPPVRFYVKYSEGNDVKSGEGMFRERDLSQIRNLYDDKKLKSNSPVQRKDSVLLNGNTIELSDDISVSDLPGYAAWPAVIQRRALMPMRIAFIGEVFFMLSSLIFLGSLVCLLSRNCCGDFSPMALWRQIREGKTEGGAQ